MLGCPGSPLYVDEVLPQERGRHPQPGRVQPVEYILEGDVLLYLWPVVGDFNSRFLFNYLLDYFALMVHLEPQLRLHLGSRPVLVLLLPLH